MNGHIMMLAAQAVWVDPFQLLAETRLAEVSQHRQQTVADGVSGWWSLLVPVVAAIFAVGIQFVASRKKRFVNRPDELFQELCKVHRIGGRGRRALIKVAQAAGLDHASELFVRVTMFDQSVLTATAQGVITRHQEAALVSLRLAMFGPTGAGSASGDVAKNRPA